MVNFVREYIPNLSEISSPLRQLLRKDIIWSWNKSHSKAFKTIKQLITEVSIFNIFDPKKTSRKTM